MKTSFDDDDFGKIERDSEREWRNNQYDEISSEDGDDDFIELKNKNNLHIWCDNDGIWHDSHGNVWFAKAYHRQEIIKKAESLCNCFDCRECEDCTGCRDCDYCTGCNDCEKCQDCSDCKKCENCSDCVDCEKCDECKECEECINVTKSTDCSTCKYSDNLTGCIDCNECDSCINIASASQESDINNEDNDPFSW